MRNWISLVVFSSLLAGCTTSGTGTNADRPELKQIASVCAAEGISSSDTAAWNSCLQAKSNVLMSQEVCAKQGLTPKAREYRYCVNARVRMAQAYQSCKAESPDASDKTALVACAARKEPKAWQYIVSVGKAAERHTPPA